MTYRRRRRRLNIPVLILLVLICLLLLSLLVLLITVRRPQQEDIEPTPTPDPRYRHAYNWDNITADGRFWTYEDEKYTSQLGVDVSFHNEEIDWQKVKNAGIDFAMIRVGYRGYKTGEIHEDSRYRENMVNAAQAGLKLGVYFFSQAVSPEEAEEEARYVLYMVRDHYLGMPIAFDMEEVTETDRIRDLTNEDRTEIAAAFCKTIRDAGYIPIIYGSERWLTDKINMEDLQDDYGFWLASYHEVSVSTDFPFVFDIWQYYNRTAIDGIDTDTDINIWFIAK